MTALNRYFEVQPLPNPLAWHAHHLPDWMLRLGTVTTLGVELLVPLMMFLPRPLRFAAAWITIFWQLLIILTSNHNWFNFLTIALCLFLFDDEALRKWMPTRMQAALGPRSRPMDNAGLDQPGPTRSRPVPAGLARVGMFALAASLVTITSAQFWELASGRRVGGPLGQVVDFAESFRVASKYHVFPTMKDQRIELLISGSIDGREWREYKFRYRPQDLERRPGLVIPHQPRLDWMLWFVTLHPKFLPWFDRFLGTLLANSPAVTALLAHNPFPDQAPRYLRVEAFRYRFSTPAERAESGLWWYRESMGLFTPLPWVERPSVLSD